MTKRTSSILLSFIGGVFLLLTVNPLLFQSYWENEADYVRHAHVALPLIPRVLPPDQSPLYYFLLHGWMRLFGTSEALTRSLSVLFGMGGLYFLYRLSGLLFRERAVSLLVTFFFATSSFLVEFSQEAKHWTLFAFLTLGSLFFLYRWFEKNRLRDLFLFLLFGTINLYSCLYTFFVFPVQLVFVTVPWVWSALTQEGGSGPRWKKRMMELGILTAWGILVAQSFHLWAGFQYVVSRGARWGLPAQFPDFITVLYRQLFYYTHQATLPFPVFLGLGTAYFFFLLGLLRMKLRETLLISFLFLFPLGVSYFIADTSSIRNRYFIHLIPLFWLSTGFGIWTVRPLPIRLMALVTIVISCSWSLVNYFTLHRKEDWKSAVAYLTPQLRADDMVVVTPYWVKAGFQFYSPFRFLATNEPRLEELTNFRRAWVLSAYGDAKIEEKMFPRFDSKGFHKVSVRGFNLSTGESLPSLGLSQAFEFRKTLESAEVSVRPFGGGPPTPFSYFGKEAFYLPGEERGVGGEGLLFDHWQIQPLSPGPERWHVVARTIQQSGGILREAIWAHPPSNGALVIHYPNLTIGKTLSGFYGFTDLSVRYGKAPVRFKIMIEGNKIYEDLKKNSAGWKEFSIDTSPYTGRERGVEFWIEAADHRWRHFCFNAFMPKEDSS